MLNPFEAINALTLTALGIVAGYQFYFLPQKIPIKRVRVGKETKYDKIFDFRPGWVWLYSVLYYPYILSTIFTLSNIDDFYVSSLSYIVLLFAHIVISYLYPLRTPDHWRLQHSINCLSFRFLRWIQSIDKGGNCFASMHVAVATLTSLHITANSYTQFHSLIYSSQLNFYAYVIGILFVWAVPIVISVSALFTKQHFLIDIPAGIILAFGAYGACYYTLPWKILENSQSVFSNFVCLGLGLLCLSRFRIHVQRVIAALQESSAQKLVIQNASAIAVHRNSVAVKASERSSEDAMVPAE